MAFKMGEALATPKGFEDRDGMAFPNPEPRAPGAKVPIEGP
jgi:hypothetical protein